MLTRHAEGGSAAASLAAERPFLHRSFLRSLVCCLPFANPAHLRAIPAFRAVAPVPCVAAVARDG
jgi:hypothetical protein